MSGVKGEKLGVFKPKDEEHGMPKNHPGEPLCKGITPGSFATREQVAYQIGKSLDIPIPPTFLVKVGGQVGSLQLFVKNEGNAGEIFSGNENEEKKNNLGSSDIQKMAYFDAVFGNTDRHLGNILIGENVFLIDNGGILSSSTEDPLKLDFIQLGLPQLEAPIDENLKTIILNPPLKNWSAICNQHEISTDAMSIASSKASFFEKALVSAKQENVDLSMKDLAIISMLAP